LKQLYYPKKRSPKKKKHHCKINAVLAALKILNILKTFETIKDKKNKIEKQLVASSLGWFSKKFRKISSLREKKIDQNCSKSSPELQKVKNEYKFQGIR